MIGIDLSTSAASLPLISGDDHHGSVSDTLFSMLMLYVSIAVHHLPITFSSSIIPGHQKLQLSFHQSMALVFLFVMIIKDIVEDKAYVIG